MGTKCAVTGALVIDIDPGLTTGVFALLVGEGKPREPIAVQIHGHEGVVPFMKPLVERSRCAGREPQLAVEVSGR